MDQKGLTETGRQSPEETALAEILGFAGQLLAFFSPSLGGGVRSFRQIVFNLCCNQASQLVGWFNKNDSVIIDCQRPRLWRV